MKIEHQLLVPFVIYTDFESNLPTQRTQSGYAKMKKDDFSWTEKRQLHTPCGVVLYVKSNNGRFFRKPVVIRGENVAEEIRLMKAFN